jgi:gamma-tubulin complex component 3
MIILIILCTVLKYSDLPGLVRSIDSAYQIASQRLFDIFLDKFRLMDHLRAMKSYLLLGRGDFADQLMESLLTSLSRPANTLYRHHLTATLEAAVRSSNARFDPPDVLRRLDARMLEYSHGEIGWDVFTLEYRVDPPIDTVIDPESMEKYLKIFHHLWKMKRVEGALGAAWNRVAGGAQSFLRPEMGGPRKRNRARSEVLERLEGEWHQIRIVLAEMIHFMRQLQAFCQLEVIECSWKELMDFLAKKEGDLDGLIQTHRNYLDRMVKKVLLMSPKAGKEVFSSAI